MDYQNLTEEQKRALAFEMGASNKIAKELEARNPDNMTDTERQRYDAWQDIADGSWKEETKQPEQLDSQSDNQSESSDNTEPSYDELRENALAKAAGQRVEGTTTGHNIIDHTGVGATEMTDQEQAVYDDMVRQLSSGDNVNNITAIKEITGVGQADGNNTEFDHTVDAAGISALINDSTIPKSVANQGLDVEQAVIATNIGWASDGDVAEKAEAVRPLNEFNNDNTPMDDVKLDIATETLEQVNDQQNNGLDMDGTSSNETEERLDNAQDTVDTMNNLN